MESTGVYWIGIFQILETHGFEVYLVNARHLKNVPGRKNDVLDCQWLQELHTFGLLSASFRREDDICVLRSYWRHRDNLIRYAASHVQHMQKALEQMNIQLHKVISDITGVTGMRIINAILFESKVDLEKNPLPPSRRPNRKPKGNDVHFDLRTHLYRMTGVDFTQLEGCDVLTVHTILAEVGLNPARFPTQKRFTSWLCLCPDN